MSPSQKGIVAPHNFLKQRKKKAQFKNMIGFHVQITYYQG
jgi:hypothetical protein